MDSAIDLWCKRLLIKAEPHQRTVSKQVYLTNSYPYSFSLHNHQYHPVSSLLYRYRPGPWLLGGAVTPPDSLSVDGHRVRFPIDNCLAGRTPPPDRTAPASRTACSLGSCCDCTGGVPPADPRPPFSTSVGRTLIGALGPLRLPLQQLLQRARPPPFSGERQKPGHHAC